MTERRSPGTKARATSTTPIADPEDSTGLVVPGMPAGADNLTAALLYAEAGWYVLPVKFDKHPGSVVGRGWQRKSSRDAKVIAAWFAGTAHGIALHCGRSGAVVFDVDHPEKLPEILRRHIGVAPFQQTRPDEDPDRGHYVFAMPADRMLGNGLGRLPKGWGEIRGANGVIVAAPNIDGRTWKRTGPLPELPAEITDLLDASSPATDAATDAAVTAFIAEHTAAARPAILAGWIKALTNKIDACESRHMSTVSVTTGAIKEARAGYYPAQTAIDALKGLFVPAAMKPSGSDKQGDARTEAEAESEFAGILAWAVGQALAADLDQIRQRTDEKMPADDVAAYAANDAAPPVPLDEALATFKTWLHIDDTAPVLAVAAAIVANLAEGDPVWFLILGPPSGGKTEILSACSSLDYVVPAAIITEAALLSGTSRKERAKDATGGLMRQIGEFGILLAKDFTSVLSQNKDTAKAAMAAMREIFDGSWDRPVGTDGGRVLHWDGKCGFVGGATPSYDRYGAVINALGDRFMLLRLPDVDPTKQAGAALRAAQHEKKMRAALAAAMLGLIAGADLTQVQADLDDNEERTLVALATFTARARTAVERDGYTGELLVMPQPEGPARLVKAMRQLYGALTALGVAADTRWDVLGRIAVDCVPAIRVPLMLQLLGHRDWRRTAPIAEASGLVTKTAARHLDDLVLLDVAERTKKKPTDKPEDDDSEPADNTPYYWRRTAWLHDHWPHSLKVRQRTTTRREWELKEIAEEEEPYRPLGSSLSHSYPATNDQADHDAANTAGNRE